MLNFKEIEEEVLKLWEKKKIYDKVRTKNKKGKRFYFLQGPPYTSGKLHIGHAWNNSMKDVVLRYKRMNNFNVWDRAGYDMHGLPTENAVQKKLEIADKLGIEKYGVEKFIKECIKFSSENAKQMNKDLVRIGVWMDFENAYLPIKNEFIEGEWWLMKKAWEQKRLYKGKKIMHWCSVCETSLAKHELEYENLTDNSIFLKFKTKDNRFLIIWTTTPWTIPFNLAIMVNPEIEYAEVLIENEKWIIAKELVDNLMGLINGKYKILKKFKGKEIKGLEYEHPFEKEIDYKSLKKKSKNIHTVILSKKYVNLESGTGLVHCAPGCGPEDYEVGKKHGIDVFNEIDEKGVFRDMGKFTGLVAKRDDKQFIDELTKKESLVAQTPVTHEYATCWRCHSPVVFRATEQWFMKIEDLIPKLLEFNKKVKWQPKFASKNYDLWIENLKDNGVTRQRYWGCPAPIWECECGHVEVIENSEEIKKKGGKIPENLHKPWIDDVKLKCPKCKKHMTRIKDIIDVWVDAGTTSWNCLEYPKNKKHFEYWPADFILEATEQIRLWFSMLQMCSAIAFGKSCYKNVYCHGMILDYQGTKMSKSLGNVISPYEVIDKAGADILRYYMCETTAGENINFNWEDVKQKQRNLNIFYNISRLLIDLNKQTNPSRAFDLEEKYIISRKNSTLKKVTELMEDYRIDEVIKEIENLLLDLSRIYIQFTRDKINSEPGKVLHAIQETYLDIIKIFSIICPFITEKIWQELKENKIVKEDSVHLCEWPKPDNQHINKKLEEEFSVVLQIVEKGLYARDKAQIGLKWPLGKAVISIDKTISKELQEIIANQLNIKKIETKKSKDKEIIVELDTNLTPELEAEGYAREISRKVQDARKKAGLIKTDKINLALVVDEGFARIINKQVETIKQRTNTSKIIIGRANEKDYSNKTDEKIKEKYIKIFLSKI